MLNFCRFLRASEVASRLNPIISHLKSHAPTKCVGCGLTFQSNHPFQAGYVPKLVHDRFAGSGRIKKYKLPRGEEVSDVPQGVEVKSTTLKDFRKLVKLMHCQTCYRLQNYRRKDHPASENKDVIQHLKEKPEGSSFFHANQTRLSSSVMMDNLVKRIRSKALVLYLVDLTNLEASLMPELLDKLRDRGCRVRVLLNKVDVLPQRRDPPDLKAWARGVCRQLANLPYNDILLVSALNGEGLSKVEARLKEDLKTSNPEWLYVVGAANSGKSTFCMRFLKFIGYKSLGSIDLHRGLGGLTRSCVPGTTGEFIGFQLPKGFRLVDTPGILMEGSMASKLPSTEDLHAYTLTKGIQPVTHALQVGKSLLVGGLLKIDMVEGTTAFVTLFFAQTVTLHICQTLKASDLLARKAGTFLYPPFTPEGFQSLFPFVKHTVEVFGGASSAFDDISISGLGWLSVAGFGKKTLDIWVPKGVQVFKRPAILPNEIRIHGVKTFYPRERARSGRINRIKKRATQRLRDHQKRDALRELLAQEEAADGSVQESRPTSTCEPGD